MFPEDFPESEIDMTNGIQVKNFIEPGMKKVKDEGKVEGNSSLTVVSQATVKKISSVTTATGMQQQQLLVHTTDNKDESNNRNQSPPAGAAAHSTTSNVRP